MAKSSTGLQENLAGLLCYALGWISGLVFFLIEKDSKLVRFHALQSIITFLGLWVLMIVSRFIPGIGHILGAVLGILSLVLWLFLMFKAFQNEKFKLPIVGDIAEKNA